MGQMRQAVSPMVKAALFDVAGTLAMPEARDAWLAGAAASIGVDLGGDGAARALAEELEVAGRPGGPYPMDVPEDVAAVYAARDRDAAARRAGYVGLLSTVALPDPRLATALYERILSPVGWTVYPDAIPTLAALRARGVATAAVSNVGFDLRPVLDGLGLLEHLDAIVLSFEVGAVKPEAPIFTAACEAIGVAPADALMVGDHAAADGGAADVGIRTLLLPMSRAGEDHGLAAVLALT
jgi:HAD superfamily hydrolase (TIGR01509 family)